MGAWNYSMGTWYYFLGSMEKFQWAIGCHFTLYIISRISSVFINFRGLVARVSEQGS